MRLFPAILAVFMSCHLAEGMVADREVRDGVGRLLSDTPDDSINVLHTDTLKVVSGGRKMSWLRRTIRGFSKIDTNYVEPQHYNWSVMAQGTYNYDYYRLSTKDQSLTFSPSPTIKFGPYFGWRWIFLGYTIDLSAVDVTNKSRKQEVDFSIYSAQIGADLFYRRTGSDYKIRNMRIAGTGDFRDLEGREFDGLSVGITGFSLYYIFNHQKFSYPAAFAQSTMQKISCGSLMAGFGYTTNSIEFDYDKMQSLIDERTTNKVNLDSGLMFNNVRYTDVNLSVGYAYNWVFAKNCLFCASLSTALAYKKTRGETSSDKEHGIDLDNFNVDAIGRFGIVYNNNRWYAGASSVVRAYNYRKTQFSANNIFGNLKIYFGYNFGARSRYKKKQ